MPETTSHRRPEREADDDPDGVADAGAGGRAGLVRAARRRPRTARRLRAEASGADGASAVCAWNHFENIPTFYNWNNRPR